MAATRTSIIGYFYCNRIAYRPNGDRIYNLAASSRFYPPRSATECTESHCLLPLLKAWMTRHRSGSTPRRIPPGTFSSAAHAASPQNGAS